MAVLFPCHQCEGRGHAVVPSGQHFDCPRCNGRGWLESTEVTPEEMQRRFPVEPFDTKLPYTGHNSQP